MVGKVSEVEGYPFGADISGYVREDGFEPSVAVLCPKCCLRQPWAEEAEFGEPLDEEGMDSLIDEGVLCEACGLPVLDWNVH